MRRHRQQLSREECVSILDRCTSGVLALTGDGGYPYAVPLSYVYSDGAIYFHSAVQGHKVDAIRRDSRYSPGDEPGLQHEIDKSLDHVLLLRLDIEHLTGKEAIELTRSRNH